MKNLTRALALVLTVLLLSLSMVSCSTPAKNPEAAKKALENNDYIILSYIDDVNELKSILGKDMGLTVYLSATDKTYENIIYIYYFESATDAKAAYAEAGKQMKRTADEEGWVIKRSGKIIYMGTEDAIEAAKE